MHRLRCGKKQPDNRAYECIKKQPGNYAKKPYFTSLHSRWHTVIEGSVRGCSHGCGDHVVPRLGKCWSGLLLHRICKSLRGLFMCSGCALESIRWKRPCREFTVPLSACGSDCIVGSRDWMISLVLDHLAAAVLGLPWHGCQSSHLLPLAAPIQPADPTLDNTAVEIAVYSQN